MADEIGDGSYGYINHVALYILGRVALHTGDATGLAQAGRTAARLRQPRESLSSQRLGGWLAALLADAGGGRGRPPPAAPVQLLDPLAAGPLSTTSPLGYADAATLTRALLTPAGRRTRRRWSPGWRTSPPAIATSRSSRRPRCTPARCSTAIPTSRCGRSRCGGGDPRPLVRAAMLEDAGRLLPAARAAEAVPLLETALGCYADAGAERDAARVRSLLRARGVRPAAGGPRQAADWPELTESEFAVVSLVARGATNREVAERLFLSPYTVSSHLRHVFTKLGIRSRAELAHIATARGMPI